MTIKPFALLMSLFAVFILAPSVVFAEDDEDAGSPVSTYVAIETPFVSNYGEPGRLRYMKVEVSLRVAGAEGEVAVRHHMPYIKDVLLGLFAIQTNDTINTAQGKEALRVKAFESINALMVKEDDVSYLEDILFTSFIVQR